MLDIGAVHRREYELGPAQKDVPAKGKGDKTGTETAEAAKPEGVFMAQAPGRVLFLGEHGGTGSSVFLAAAIDRCAKVAVSARKDTALRFHACDLNERKRTTMASLKYKREDRWANHVKVAIQLFVDIGAPVKGLNFTLAGNIPRHVGLASSCAVEVASAMALRALLRSRITEAEMARRLADIHSLYFGVNKSAVDYVIGLSARADQFLLVDEATLGVTKIKSPFSRCKIVLADSRVPRLGIDDEIRSRREDVAAALEALSQGRKKASLRDFAAPDIMDSMGNLPERIRRRSLHAVQDMRRAQDAAEALRKADLAGFARLVFHSHESLRDLYEVSCPEIDWMVKRAQETQGVFGARMMGQGFGGCTYAIVRDDALAEYRHRLEDYERIFGFHPLFHEAGISTGSRLVQA
ncbi:MAG: galactokinase [Treponema sp.]|nr:galactokinase [Treponema sp.]